MTDALSRQIGGSHYVNLAVQPMEFALRNGWDSAAHSILKYVTRHKDKHKNKGFEDLEKSIHICDIRVQILPQLIQVFMGRPVIFPDPRSIPADVGRAYESVTLSMESYISLNQIEDPEAAALTALDRWVLRTGIIQSKGENERAAREVKHLIGLIIARHYPDKMEALECK